MQRKVSTKTFIISIAIVVGLIILYFLIFVVDIFNYIQNYDYLKEAGVRANELHEEIVRNNKEFKKHEEERQETKDTFETIINHKN